MAEPPSPAPDALPSETRIGHVHLTVSDLERSLRFYRDVLGFHETGRLGDSAVFLAAGDYHHHIALNTWAGKGAPRPAPGTTGLFHVAIVVPSRRDLAVLLRRLHAQGWPLEGAADHGPTESLYLRDPDGNGVEVYADRPKDQWPRDAEGRIAERVAPLDLEDLLREAEGPH